MQIAEKTVVSIHYTLTAPGGDVLDSSSGKDPLTYLHGVGMLLPGLETALVGKGQGDQVTVDIAAAEAYGERDEAMVQAVPRAQFSGIDNIQKGMQFQAQTPDGRGHLVTVVAVTGEEVTIDGNHPLAGVPLHFEVEIVEVREATDEELSHGHVHGPGGTEH